MFLIEVFLTSIRILTWVASIVVTFAILFMLTFNGSCADNKMRPVSHEFGRFTLIDSCKKVSQTLVPKNYIHRE